MKRRDIFHTSRAVWIDYMLCVGAVLLIGLFFATGILNTQKVWPDVKLDHVRDNASYSLEEGDTYGIKATGPYYDLDKGMYKVKWQVNGDGANVIRFCNSTGGEIVPSEVYTEPGEWQGETYIEIKEPVHNFYISVDFADGTWMEIYNFRLYSPEYADMTWAATLIILLLLFLVLLNRNGWMDTRRKEIICVLGIVVLMTSLPLLCQDMLEGADSDFHAGRLMNLADGLRTGQFPVRAGGFAYNGYGAITSIFYPDLLLYPFAWMILCGASLPFVTNILRMTIIVLLAVNMYISARRIFRCHEAALGAAILYVCSPYCLTCIYKGFMLGQIMALAFIPLFLLGISEVIWGDKECWPILVLSATLICQSHLISTMLCAGFAVVVGVLYLPKILCEKRFTAILKAICATAMVNLFFLVPMLTGYFSGTYSSPVQFGFVEAALPIREILIPDKWIGMTILIGIAGFWAYCEKTEKVQKAKWFCIAGCLIALLCTNLIPWGHIVALTRELVTIIQFPSRFMILAVPLLCLCAGYGYSLSLGRVGHGMIVVAFIALISVMPQIVAWTEKESVLEFGMTANPYMDTPEYQIIGTDVGATRDKAPMISDDVQLTEYKKNGTEVSAEVASAKGGSIEFPLFAFEGYKAELDGLELEIGRGSNNRIHVDIPSGAEGTLHIWFAGKMLWRIADAISLATLLALCASLIKGRKNASVA